MRLRATAGLRRLRPGDEDEVFSFESVKVVEAELSLCKESEHNTWKSHCPLTCASCSGGGGVRVESREKAPFVMGTTSASLTSYQHRTRSVTRRIRVGGGIDLGSINGCDSSFICVAATLTTLEEAAVSGGMLSKVIRREGVEG